MKILLAVDGSAYSKKMLAYLATHDAMFSPANEYVVFTVQAALPSRARAAVGKEVVESYYADESEKVIAPVTKFLMRHGIDAKSSWKVGAAGALIAKRVKEYKVLAYGELGPEAVASMTVEDFPMIVVMDAEGKDFYQVGQAPYVQE